PTAPHAPYALSLHDALPIFPQRSGKTRGSLRPAAAGPAPRTPAEIPPPACRCCLCLRTPPRTVRRASVPAPLPRSLLPPRESSADRKSTRLNSSHVSISYAV